MLRLIPLFLIIPSVFAREESIFTNLFETIGYDGFNYIAAFLFPTYIVFFALQNLNVGVGTDKKGSGAIAGSIGFISAISVVTTQFNFIGFIMSWFSIVLAISLFLITWLIIKAFTGGEVYQSRKGIALMVGVFGYSMAFFLEGMVEQTGCSTGLISDWMNICNGALVNDFILIGTLAIVYAAVSFFSNLPKDSAGEGLGSRILRGLSERRDTIPNADKDDPASIPNFADYQDRHSENFINDIPGATNPVTGESNVYDDKIGEYWNRIENVLDITGGSFYADLTAYSAASESDKADLLRDIRAKISSIVNDCDLAIKATESEKKSAKTDLKIIEDIIKRHKNNVDPAVRTEITGYNTLRTRYQNTIRYYDNMITIFKNDKDFFALFDFKLSRTAKKGGDAELIANYEKKFKKIKKFNKIKFEELSPAQITNRKDIHEALLKIKP